ncbi:hypothetical protein lbkm_4069 [Lachnospiraceae bacterium KM106-2]|nr:hypothetical protein lbkm_4069 [Lachnospiraceae bacterium KM106-2]
MERLEKQIQFILELDKIKKIRRQTYLTDGIEKEDDAQHSWHLAVMCIILQEYANESIDVLKTMSMVLIHDVIEIDAGDTYAYDEAGNQTKQERELKAAERIFNILPQDQAEYMRSLWDEFEEMQTAESKFANAMDKIQPMLLNDATGGKAWREHGVAISQIMERNSHTKEATEQLWDHMSKILHKNIDLGNIRKDEEEWNV